MDIKGPNLIKPHQFEGLRVLGKPAEFAKRYADHGADELLYIDTVASLYGRNQLEGILEEADLGKGEKSVTKKDKSRQPGRPDVQNLPVLVRDDLICNRVLEE